MRQFAEELYICHHLDRPEAHVVSGYWGLHRHTAAAMLGHSNGLVLALIAALELVPEFLPSQPHCTASNTERSLVSTLQATCTTIPAAR